jgi:hypothetical protein
VEDLLGGDDDDQVEEDTTMNTSSGKEQKRESKASNNNNKKSESSRVTNVSARTKLARLVKEEAAIQNFLSKKAKELSFVAFLSFLLSHFHYVRSSVRSFFTELLYEKMTPNPISFMQHISRSWVSTKKLCLITHLHSR